MEQIGHIGITALDTERAKLLQEYDLAVAQAADDPVKTEHGVSCEAHFRSFLSQFLPRKYGVTKGYIITPDLEYAGPLEEWDIIIYDAMESPVLFVRQTRDENDASGKRGIPVEYVRGVIEVKATFNKAMAEKVTQKLLKLRQFQKKEDSLLKYGEAHLSYGFRAFAVFFETKVKNSREYADALGALAKFWQADPLLAFCNALIIRGQNCPEYSASVGYTVSTNTDFTNLFSRCCEISDPVPSFVDGMQTVVVSGGYGQNEFWQYMIDMVDTLNGHDDDSPGMGSEVLTDGYGIRAGANRNVRLFPRELSEPE